jgi:hypothetical protein
VNEDWTSMNEDRGLRNRTLRSSNRGCGLGDAKRCL